MALWIKNTQDLSTPSSLKAIVPRLRTDNATFWVISLICYYYHFRYGLPFFYVDFCRFVHLDLWQNAISIESTKYEKRQTDETVKT